MAQRVNSNNSRSNSMPRATPMDSNNGNSKDSRSSGDSPSSRSSGDSPSNSSSGDKPSSLNNGDSPSNNPSNSATLPKASSPSSTWDKTL